MRRIPLSLILVFTVAVACSSTTEESDDAGTTASSAGGATTSGANGGAGGADGGQGGVGGMTTPGDVCLPTGVFGKCSDNPDCFCLLGATVYQFCTIGCDEPSECGGPSAAGAVPGCYPINPGAADKICALICTDTSQCPCGLTCMPSGVPNINLCAELQ